MGRCNGTHPNDINSQKRNINSMNSGINNVLVNVQKKLREFKEQDEILKTDINTMYSYFYTIIPNKIKENEKTKKRLLDAKIVALDKEKQSTSNKLGILGNKLSTLDGLRSNAIGLTSSQNAAGKYIQTVTSNNVKQAGIDMAIKKQTYNAVRVENNVLNEHINDTHQSYSTDDSAKEYIITKLVNIKSLHFWLLVLYYIFVIGAVYSLLYIDINKYYKITMIGILLIYPFIIYNIQNLFHDIWNWLYAYLRSYPENK
jgi:hypothetical protein